MSVVGQPWVDGGAIFVGSFDMPQGRRFDRHSHDGHQLAWAASGVLTVDVGAGAWLLPPARALWIPAGVAHVTSAAQSGVMRSCYLVSRRCPIRWAEPTVVAVSPLLRELIVHLAQAPQVDSPPRRRAEAVVFDLLAPAPAAAIDVPLPNDARARQVADALIAEPDDRRSLDDWGRHVGASGRTLARLFAAEVGMGFGEWRTQLRIRAALAHLAAGTPVSVVARQVGYRNSSAFVAAFHHITGHTPGTYLR